MSQFNSASFLKFGMLSEFITNQYCSPTKTKLKKSFLLWPEDTHEVRDLRHQWNPS